MKIRTKTTKQRYNNLCSRSRDKNLKTPSWNEFAYLVRKSFQSGFRCEYCGIVMKFNGGEQGKDVYSIDHKTPLSLGGSNEIKNLCVCCERCNMLKGQMLEKEFKEFVVWWDLWQSLFQSV